MNNVRTSTTMLFMLLLLAASVFAQERINGSFVVDGTVNYCADAGASDTYACTMPVPLAVYTTGGCYIFKANTANTGAASINFDSLGAKTIKKVAGGVTTDLSDNDIRSGQLVNVCYDGTNMQMQSTLGNAASGGGSGGSITDTYANIIATTCDASYDGYIGLPTDSFYSSLRCKNGTGWEHFFQGKLTAPPSTATLSTDINTPIKTTTNGGVYVGGAAGTMNVRAIVTTYPATPFSVEVAFIPNWYANASYKNAAGIIFRDSAGGSLAVFGASNLDIGLNQFTSATSAASLIRSSSGLGPRDKVFWLKMTDDGATRRFYESHNGIRWVEILSSQGSTAFITANQLGLAIWNEDGTYEAGATFLYYKVY